MILGVIDIGSNTFHLIITRISNGSFEILARKRKFVYISRDGLDQISDEARVRAIDTMIELKAICNTWKVDRIEAVATASLRTARNAQDIIQEVKEKTNIDIQVISGDEEARLILEGTKLLPLNKDTEYLIMDIGGGSVEFIAIRNNEHLHHKSFDIGISHLRKDFPPSNPLTKEEKDKVLSYLRTFILEFKSIDQGFKPQVLIGASGPFEIVENYMNLEPQASGNLIKLDDVQDMLDQTLGLTLEERQALDFMPEARADLAIESFLLITSVLGAYPEIQAILVSPYAMKEGIVSKYLDKSKK